MKLMCIVRVRVEIFRDVPVVSRAILSSDEFAVMDHVHVASHRDRYSEFAGRLTRESRNSYRRRESYLSYNLYICDVVTE